MRKGGTRAERYACERRVAIQGSGSPVVVHLAHERQVPSGGALKEGKLFEGGQAAPLHTQAQPSREGRRSLDEHRSLFDGEEEEVAVSGGLVPERAHDVRRIQ